MKEYSFTEARQKFASLLDEARREGAVCVRRRNGEAFHIKPATTK
ncbi:MAG: type II toxin-antitoxin system prevent-host-death family antitoxin, partial [Gammaproteobacteria bacterium]|nr:type II toxin-antitoxin system prevent-host-death family antitoxin [Gammaproteobacteria bacterium]